MQRILLEDRRGKHVSNDERSSIGSAYRKRYSIMMAGCHQPLASHVVKKTNGWCVQATLQLPHTRQLLRQLLRSLPNGVSRVHDGGTLMTG